MDQKGTRIRTAEARKCPKCVEEGLKSTLNMNTFGVSTLMAVHEYYDEDGKHHYHDPNGFTREWHCSNGHKGTLSRRGGCPTCQDFVEEMTTALIST